MSNIYQAITEIMADVEAIGKDKRNQQQGFNFRGIDDVYNSIHPLFAKHGVFSVPFVESERTEDRLTKNGGNLIYRILTIRYTFYASDGSFIEARVLGEGMDSGDKGANKAMAIAHKYALLQVLCIPTEDMPDPDSETPTMKDSDLGQRQSTRTYSRPESHREPEYFPEQAGPESFQGDELKETPKRHVGVIPENLFNAKDGYHQLVEKADGDKDFVNSTLKNLGLTRPGELTYDQYKKALAFVSLPHAEGVTA